MFLKKYGKNILITLLTLWALSASIAYWNMSRTPRVLATQLGKSLLENETSVSDLEETEFLKFFTENYYSFDSKDYWQDQLQLTYVMKNSLATQRLEELQSINIKSKSSYLSQQARILSIQEIKPSAFEVYTQIRTELGTEKHTNLNRTVIQTQKIQRTLDNPYGIQIENLESFPLEKNSSTKNIELFLKPHKTAVFVFHCPILNIETLDNKNISTKTINSKFSEVHLSVTNKDLKDLSLKFKCENIEFNLVAKVDSNLHTLWFEIPMDLAQPLQKIKKIDKRFDKDIEKLLNVEITN